ncbi:hypothetical protein BC567DRAFT_42305 [Phyllosticta citribraziliensis]
MRLPSRICRPVWPLHTYWIPSLKNSKTKQKRQKDQHSGIQTSSPAKHSHYELSFIPLTCSINREKIMTRESLCDVLMLQELRNCPALSRAQILDCPSTRLCPQSEHAAAAAAAAATAASSSPPPPTTTTATTSPTPHATARRESANGRGTVTAAPRAAAGRTP